MIKVLFVCHGNICRSPMAEAILKSIVTKEQLNNQFIVDSAAVSDEEIGNPVYDKALEVLKVHGITKVFHLARKVTIKDYEYFDYILVMDDSNYCRLTNLIGTDYLNKIKKLGLYLEPNCDIEDPWYTGNFEYVYQMLETAIKNFLKEII